jgi:hypothetical protein
MPDMNSSAGWEHVKADVFWGEIADCQHVIQVYENDEVLIDTLMGFVVTGINVDDCCIIIATGNHLRTLDDHLEAHGFDVATLLAEGKYMPVNAEKLLSQFVINGFPNKELYTQSGAEIMTRARETKRMIRMFGETSPLLWAMGHKATALEMEHLANELCETESVCVFCAYSKDIFNEGTTSFIDHICSEHSKMISGSQMQLHEIYFRDSVTA